MTTQDKKIQQLQRDIRESRDAALEAAGRICAARDAGDLAKRRESDEELRRIVAAAHDARRALEAIRPGELFAVEDEIDHIYATARRFDTSALDRLEERDAAREFGEKTARKIEALARDIRAAREEIEDDGFPTIQGLYVRVVTAHISADELSRLAGPVGISLARKRLAAVEDDLDYIYRVWRETTDEDFSPDSWNRLALLEFHATVAETA